MGNGGGAPGSGATSFGAAWGGADRSIAMGSSSDSAMPAKEGLDVCFHTSTFLGSIEIRGGIA